MEIKLKKQAAALGGRIGLSFLIASSVLIFVAYFVLSQNFQKLLTDYTLKLTQSMVDQGVFTIEAELSANRDAAANLAEAFTPPVRGQAASFPSAYLKPNVLRIVYISHDGAAFASDGVPTTPNDRPDIIEAFTGNTAIYGPYFNAANEFVVCYSAPVRVRGEITGVVSIEKDGYYFSKLIQDIRFAGTGECYIINAEGTDIAVSDQNHMEWVNTQYNAQNLLTQQHTEETLSIMELEQNGLDGNAGIGTYYWENGLCYLAYAPIPSEHWVLLAGLRQEEIDSMTRSVLYLSITKGPALTISIIIFLLLTVVTLYWIVSSMKKNAEINERLNQIANYDALTGTLNRYSYHKRLEALSKEVHRSLSCIYIDVNGLHEINNHLGHQAGDLMLKAVADALHRLFAPNNIYRIGGDEFVVFCQELERQDVCDRLQIVRQELRKQGYEISAGVEWRSHDLDATSMVNAAEEIMLQDKQLYYRANGKERQMRILDRKLEQIFTEKQDADKFLSALAPEFKGVYFVDIGLDTIRHLNIPPYFEKMLVEADDVFSKALILYSRRMVNAAYRRDFEAFCDYSSVAMQLKNNVTPELTYQRTDGSWMKLRILKFKTYTTQNRETLWIFSSITGKTN